jgi:hypothetical protein
MGRSAVDPPAYNISNQIASCPGYDKLQKDDPPPAHFSYSPSLMAAAIAFDVLMTPIA